MSGFVGNGGIAFGSIPAATASIKGLDADFLLTFGYRTRPLGVGTDIVDGIKALKIRSSQRPRHAAGSIPILQVTKTVLASELLANVGSRLRRQT
jgi:hypothetical protein